MSNVMTIIVFKSRMSLRHHGQKETLFIIIITIIIIILTIIFFKNFFSKKPRTPKVASPTLRSIRVSTPEFTWVNYHYKVI